MIILESRVKEDFDNDINHCPTGHFIDGYFLTIYDLLRLVRDFQVDSDNEIFTDNELYIKEWLKTHDQIVKNTERNFFN